jgi:POT family proton-dependent oligopeptide transporter
VSSNNTTETLSVPTSAGVDRARHPRGLYTLFFTEMWERFSYYGMRALLVLFMVDSVRGGMGMSDHIATSIYGLYTAAVYMASLPGGWIADRLLGAQRCVWYGGIFIAAGHFTLAIPRVETFYLGLLLVVIGTGLLKPNISAIVGELYPEGGARRDAGFSIFYMGINLGAFIGPFVCSALGEKINWHLGFGAAGVGMVLGLIQYRLSRNRLGTAGLSPGQEKPLGRLHRAGLILAATAILLVAVLAMAGVLKLNPVALARGTTTFIVGIAVIYFAAVLLFGGLDKAERQRVIVIIVLFVAAALFWAGFEQAGSSFNLFAQRYTARYLTWFKYEIPAGWFQMLGPFFVITFAPVAAAVWVNLAPRNLDPSIPAKFGWGLLLLAAGFLVMATAAKAVAAGHKVWPSWLVTTYLLHTFGELCLSPVGLSSVTKLSPRRFVGQMMGVWFLGASLGNLIAGLIASEFSADTVAQMPTRYLHVAIMPLVAGLLLILLAKPMKRLMIGIR